MALEGAVSITNGSGTKEGAVAHRLNAVYEVVRRLEDQVVVGLKSGTLMAFLNQIQTMKSNQASYSGLATRIWSQLVRLGGSLEK